MAIAGIREYREENKTKQWDEISVNVKTISILYFIREF
jgi:hypothetical protein